MARRRGPDPQDDLRYRDPPYGFVVLQETDLDPANGRAGRWLCRGVIGNQTVIRTGMSSRPAACRAAWLAVDDARIQELSAEYLHEDTAVAEWLAAKHARWREYVADGPKLKSTYTVELDSWDHMEASILAQVIEDAGSIRRAAKVMDIPRSTLSARVRRHRAQGTWPKDD